MSRLDYHSILDTNTNVDVDVDAEFDNPTILDTPDDQHHDDSHDGHHQHQLDEPTQTHTIHGGIGILDEEHDESPFVIMEEPEPGHEGVEGEGEVERQLMDDVQLAAGMLPEPENVPITQIPLPPTGSEYTESNTGTQPSGKAPMSLKGMTSQEKKDRQRLQNRLAAERSRNKRKGDQNNLEKQVESLQSENSQLRARLSALLASKSPELVIPPSSTDHPQDVHNSSSLIGQSVLAGTGIDYNYINKLTNELNQTKMTLLERKLKLMGIQNGDAATATPIPAQELQKEGNNSTAVELGARGEGEVIDTEREDLSNNRKDLIKVYSKLRSIKAEEKSLNTLTEHVKNEIQNLIRQRELVEKKLNERRNTEGNGAPVQMVNTENEDLQAENGVGNGDDTNPQPDHVKESQLVPDPQDQDQNEHNDQDEDQMNEDKALDDIRGWIDAAVKDWDQNLPSAKGMEVESDNQ
ncbi:hypothetical protein I302_103904 [Kwoniella bestiolae CBS 10118]|uniref:BZIP domain-containing protein n=1 Tax=Kwoniella bestiolae CBS 10118 TaxID=1296100 RepID=A0A1B9G9S5_9TREE|nr:hypothetical protein I302_02609 [Kwoniella bestiolae CBS 10118]OCF27763.1 hypothetical protein I302_02609 [Kwoniella bestiolae CBS 10118]